MGNLPAGYYEDLIKKTQSTPVQPPVISNNQMSTETTMAIAPQGPGFFEQAQQNAVEGALKFSNISPEKQTSRFGGEVGSPEYYKYKSEHPYTQFLPKQVAGAFGIPLPKDEEWDTMSRANQALYLGALGTTAVAKMFTELPKEIVKAPVRLGLSLYQPWSKLAKGEDISTEALGKEKVTRVPLLGEVPTYWQSYDEAINSGAGPLGATLMSASTALGDISIAGATAEALVKGLQPRSVIKKGQVVKNTGPIQNALVTSQEGLMKGVVKRESASEYYRIPKTTAKELGGNTNNTFLKITPAGADSVEVAVVQMRNGLVPKTIDYVKNKLGNVESTYAGDFGPETKLQSQIVQLPKTAQPETFYHGTTIEGAANIQNNGFKIINEGMNRGNGISLSTDKSVAQVFSEKSGAPGKVFDVNLSPNTRLIPADEFIAMKNSIAEKTGFDTATQKTQDLFKSQGFDGIDFRGKGNIPDAMKNEVRIWNPEKIQMNQTSISEEAAQKVLSSIPPKALKGFENKAITSDQIGNLNLIGRVNGVDPGIQDAVMRTITGKKAVGELTQAEYVKTAQTLASFNELGKYAPDAGAVNIFSQYGSPQRYWMRTYEEKTGMPLYTDAYVPMEEAVRLRDVFRDSYRNEARDIFGKYAGQGFAEERRLIKNYMEGDTAAVTGNSTLTPETKADLIKIADQMRPLYDKLGSQFGVPTDVFLKDYQPHIQDMGGIYQLYKSGQDIPKSLEFFSKFKRKGSINVQIDDSLALFDIYTNAGSNSLFLNPVLDRVGALGSKLPDTLKGSLRSYVQEKLGYAGQAEEYLNKVGENINKKLGTNLPPDVIRQVTQLYMDSTYAGAMGLNPGTVFRNSLQYDLLAYPRLGPDFYKSALDMALTKEGMAEVRNAGFLVGTGEPYGQALTQDVNILGKAGNLYRKGAQATLQPFSVVESFNRARTYWQTKLQFNDALEKYNSGKLTWSQFEDKLKFYELNKADQNIIRQRLIAGDVKGAFENLVRDIIDETQFPYRKAASSKITYGLLGRLGTQFQQWNIEFVHTLGKWVGQAAKGHPENLIRFAASSYAIQRSLEEAMGFDFTRSVATGPFSANLSPAIKTGIDILNTVNAWKQGNAQTLNDSADSIVKTMKSLGVPAGVEIQKWNSFLQSYNKGPVGPNGQYGVYDQRGRLQYYTDFQDIFWQMWGFPTTQSEQYRAQVSDLKNASFNYSQQKQKVLELYQQEKYDEANELINEYGIKIGPNDFDAYYIPYTDRAFQALPNTLKGQFAPQLYK